MNKFYFLISAVIIAPLSVLSMSCASPDVDPPKPGPDPDPTPIPPYTSFGVNQGLKTWGEHFIAPFIDEGNYWGYATEFGNKGGSKMVELSSKINSNKFNLGFIQSVPGSKDEPNPTLDGKILWGFAGNKSLSEDTSPLNEQYQGIKDEMLRIRNAGGDFSISFGGLNGVAPWILSGVTEDMLYDFYLKMVYGFGLTHIDLDIEGSAQGETINNLHAKAIKRVQEKTNVRVNITIPIEWSGLVNDGIGTLSAFLKEDVKINDINVMAMCYSNFPLDGRDFGDFTKNCVDEASNQIVKLYKTFDQNISRQEAYGKIGIIPSIGVEDAKKWPTFTKQMHQKVVDFAKEKKVASMSMWCLDRDAKVGFYKDNVGVVTPFEFSEISKNFLN